MISMYDMVSGKWQIEGSGKAEATPQYSHPSTAAETAATRIESHTGVVPEERPMPPDLVAVDVSYFLDSQVTPT